MLCMLPSVVQLTLDSDWLYTPSIITPNYRDQVQFTCLKSQLRLIYIRTKIEIECGLVGESICK